MRAGTGVMISASHNPYEDNGIKIFGRDGYKLPDEMEYQLESGLEAIPLSIFGLLGSSRLSYRRWAAAIARLKQVMPSEIDLAGMRIVMDCANGAAYKVAPTAGGIGRRGLPNRGQPRRA